MSNRINELKILKNFFGEPHREFHLRELGRITRYNPSTLSKYLNRYIKSGILTKKRERGHVLYKADTESDIFKLKKIYYNVERIHESGIIKFLESSLNHPKSIVLFGSYSKGENVKRSDLDLFILTEEKKEINLEKFERILGCEINILKYNEIKFKKMRQNNKELLNNIINGIVIYGYLEVF